MKKTVRRRRNYVANGKHRERVEYMDGTVLDMMLGPVTPMQRWLEHVIVLLMLAAAGAMVMGTVLAMGS